MFTRMQQRAMHRGAGATGCRVLLVDKSTSMPLDAFGMLDEVMPAIQRTHPGIRVYAFFYGVEEVRFTSIRDSIKYIQPPDGIPDDYWESSEPWGASRRNHSRLGHALAYIAGLNPESAIVVSDGGAADKRLALRAADQMTGSIDAYFCHARNGLAEDVNVMRKLARRGRGELVGFPTTVDGLIRAIERSFRIARPSPIHIQAPHDHVVHVPCNVHVVPVPRVIRHPAPLVHVQPPRAPVQARARTSAFARLFAPATARRGDV